MAQHCHKKQHNSTQTTMVHENREADKYGDEEKDEKHKQGDTTGKDNGDKNKQ